MARSLQVIKDEIETLINSDATLKNMVLPINPVVRNDADNISPFQWLKIQTTESDYSDRNYPAKQINFLIVKIYTPEQSAVIETAITSEDSSLVFSKKGDLKAGRNVIVNESASTVDSNRRYVTLNDSHQTIDFRDLVVPHLEVDLYGYSKNVVFNPDLTYILYRLPSNGTYVLLYNPLHRKNFKKFYKLLHEYGTQIDTYGYGLTESIRIGTQDFSYRSFIRRYCNSFVVDSRKKNKGLGAKNSVGKIYADPFCAIMIDYKQAMLNSYFVSNIVESYYYSSYWSKPATRDEIVSMVAELTRTNSTSWACNKSTTPINSYSFIREMTNNDSFIEYLAKININGHENPNVKLSNLDQANPVCSKPTVIQCVIAAISAGDIRDTTLQCPEDAAMKRIIDESKRRIGSGGSGSGGSGSGGSGSGGSGSGGSGSGGSGSGGSGSGGSGSGGSGSGGSGGSGSGGSGGNSEPYSGSDNNVPKDEWNPMYTYIILAIVILLVIILMYFMLFRGSPSVPSV